MAYFGRDKKLLTKYLTPKMDYIYLYFKDVSREFDEFQVNRLNYSSLQVAVLVLVIF